MCEGMRDIVLDILNESNGLCTTVSKYYKNKDENTTKEMEKHRDNMKRRIEEVIDHLPEKYKRVMESQRFKEIELKGVDLHQKLKSVIEIIEEATKKTYDGNDDEYNNYSSSSIMHISNIMNTCNKEYADNEEIMKITNELTSKCGYLLRMWRKVRSEKNEMNKNNADDACNKVVGLINDLIGVLNKLNPSKFDSHNSHEEVKGEKVNNITITSNSTHTIQNKQEINYYNVDTEGRMYYSYEDDKFIGIRVRTDVMMNTEMMRNAQMFEADNKKYCFYDCVSFVLTTPWEQFQNDISVHGGEIMMLNVTIPLTQNTPHYYKLGERSDFHLEGDFPLILPIQI